MGIEQIFEVLRGGVNCAGRLKTRNGDCVSDLMYWVDRSQGSQELIDGSGLGNSCMDFRYRIKELRRVGNR